MFYRLLETMLLLTTSKGLLLCRCQAFEKMDDTIHSFYLLIGCGGHLGIAFMRVGGCQFMKPVLVI